MSGLRQVRMVAPANLSICITVAVRRAQVCCPQISHPLAGTATDKTVAVITERGQASLRRVFEAERARRFVVSKHLAKAR